MEHTKYRGIYIRKNQDGTSSYYVRCTLSSRQTWRRAGSTVSEARRFQEAVRQAQAREKLGFKLPERKRFNELTDMYVEDYLKRKGDKNYSRMSSVNHISLQRQLIVPLLSGSDPGFFSGRTRFFLSPSLV